MQELISRASSAATGAVEPSLAPAPSEAASADDEAGQQATSALKAAAPATIAAAGALETAEDVKPRLAGAKRPFEVTREPSFSFPVLVAPAAQALAAPASRALAMPAAAAVASNTTSAAPASAAVAVGKRGKTQYDRMRELEGQVQQIKAVGDTLVMAVRHADAQYSVALSENQQLWALVAHLTACLRAGQAAATTSTGAGASEPATAAAAPSTGGTPDLLLGSLFSPDAADLAAACGMFVSPLKMGAAAPAANKPRRLFEGEAGVVCGVRPSQGEARDPAGSCIMEIPTVAIPQAASVMAAY